MNTITLNGRSLTIKEVVAVARQRARVSLDPSVEAALNRSREFVDGLVERGEVVYGITTGFGRFKNVVINKEQTEELQVNLIRSHATGVGAPFSEEVVRASIVIRINSLLQGYSGVRPIVVHRLMEMLNKNIYPYVPSKGSVGSSGDLAPLCNIILVLIGEGEVIVNGERKPAKGLLAERDFEPIVLQSKEGLALNNGTAVQTGVGALAVHDARELATLFDVSLSMSLEGMMGSLKAYEQKVHALRPHPGQEECASNIRKLIGDSEIIKSHEGCDRVQDSYTLRCAPQVHGASRDAIRHVEQVVTRELNSVTDNPLIFAEDQEAISAGHFHGEPIAQVMDYLKIAVCELANISERRIAKLVDPAYSEGLPAFLVPAEQAGLSSGYMIPQYVAAALVSENKVLAHPASVDSIPTSANVEDHVSMGTIAARQAAEIVGNARSVLAIELMCAAQALDLRKPLTSGVGTSTAYDTIRKYIPFLDKDRTLYRDVEDIENMVIGAIRSKVEEKIGKLV